MSQAIEHPQHHADTRYGLTEVAQLALELQADEGLDLDTALDRAAAQLDELAHYHPYLWDSTAFNAGNWEAFAGAMPF